MTQRGLDWTRKFKVKTSSFCANDTVSHAKKEYKRSCNSCKRYKAQLLEQNIFPSTFLIKLVSLGISLWRRALCCFSFGAKREFDKSAVIGSVFFISHPVGGPSSYQ